MIKSEILVPLLNANEPEARLAGIHVKEGQPVEKGTILFTLETTKAAADVEAPAAGFVRILARVGDVLAVGDKLGLITETTDEPVEVPAKGERGIPFEGGLRITRPARVLAEQLGLDFARLPLDRLVTEEVVRQITSTFPKIELSISPLDKPHLLIYGGGGHAKTIMDMVLAIDTFTIIGIVDDKIPAGTTVLGIPVLGSRVILAQLIEQGIRQAANGVGGIIDINIRVNVFELLENAGFSFPALIHPRAKVEPSASIGEGVQVFANAYVGSEAILHPRCMVNTNAVISHDCAIGAYSHVAPGALLAGHVQVGERTLVGMGVTTSIGVRIGDGARIGNGAILLADVPDRTIIQAGRFWTGKKDSDLVQSSL